MQLLGRWKVLPLDVEAVQIGPATTHLYYNSIMGIFKASDEIEDYNAFKKPKMDLLGRENRMCGRFSLQSVILKRLVCILYIFRERSYDPVHPSCRADGTEGRTIWFFHQYFWTLPQNYKPLLFRECVLNPNSL